MEGHRSLTVSFDTSNTSIENDHVEGLIQDPRALDTHLCRGLTMLRAWPSYG